MQKSWQLSDLSANAATILVIALLCVGAVYLLTINNSVDLSNIPGPYLAKYTDAYGAIVALKLSSAKSGPVVASWSRDLQRKYGTTVRTGPNTETILDPRAIQPIYGVRAKLDKVRCCGRHGRNST